MNNCLRRRTFHTIVEALKQNSSTILMRQICINYHANNIAANRSRLKYEPKAKSVRSTRLPVQRVVFFFSSLYRFIFYISFSAFGSSILQFVAWRITSVRTPNRMYRTSARWNVCTPDGPAERDRTGPNGGGRRTHCARIFIRIKLKRIAAVIILKIIDRIVRVINSHVCRPVTFANQ